MSATTLHNGAVHRGGPRNGTRRNGALNIRALRATGYWAHRFRRSWRRSIAPSFVAPCIYLVIMGKVLGSLVTRNPGSLDRLGGADYISFVGPAIVASSAVMTATAEATQPVFAAARNTKVYTSMLATPLGVRDVLLGHLLWMSIRITATCAALVALMAALGAAHSLLVLLVPIVGALTGMSVACGVAGFAIRQTRSANLLMWQRFGATPMMLFAGVYFPVSLLPWGLRAAVYVTPLWHGVELSRHLALGDIGVVPAIGHTLYLFGCIALGGWWAMRAFDDRLVD